MTNSFQARTTLKVGAQHYEICSLGALKAHNVDRLPFSLKILLENLLRFEDGVNVTRTTSRRCSTGTRRPLPHHEIAFTPARVIMQDFTGVPCIVDLAAMREAIVRLGGDPQRVNPLAPAELVIDHSVQVDEYGTADSLEHNNEIEFSRNGERYMFLRWGQTAFSNFKVVPPNTGIVHQVNLEHLARVVFSDDRGGKAARLSRHAGRHRLAHHHDQRPRRARLGRRRHRGRGGDARSAGHHADPAGHRLQAHGQLAGGHHRDRSGAHGHRDAAQEGRGGQVRRVLRRRPQGLPLADRATIANMSPEFGTTCAIFPIDEETIRYLELTGRPAEQIALVEAYAKAQGLWRIDGATGGRLHRRGGARPRARSSPRSPARSARRTACRCARRRASTDAACKKMAEERAQKNPAASGKATAAARRQDVRARRTARC